MATKSNNPYYGIYYKTNGRWTGPYAGKKYTMRGLTRYPLSEDLKWLKNNCLKSRIQLRRVKA